MPSQSYTLFALQRVGCPHSRRNACNSVEMAKFDGMPEIMQNLFNPAMKIKRERNLQRRHISGRASVWIISCNRVQVTHDSDAERRIETEYSTNREYGFQKKRNSCSNELTNTKTSLPGSHNGWKTNFRKALSCSLSPSLLTRGASSVQQIWWNSKTRC